MRTLLFILLIGLINNICIGQGNVNFSAEKRSIFVRKGDYYFNKKEFGKSMVYYNMAYKQNANNYYSILRKAEAYTNSELYPQAEECYRFVFENSEQLSNIYNLKYALILLKNNKTKEFYKWLNKYNETVKADIENKNYISSKKERGKLYKDSTFILIDNLQELNTTESEISPIVYNDQILFASMRKGTVGNISNNNYDIFSANYLRDGSFGKVGVFNHNLNTSQNEGSLSFFDVTNTMYFTRSTSHDLKLKSYISNIPIKENDALDITNLNIGNFNSIGHPALSNNGTKIYFVSDAPGGFGGLDIYSSVLEQGNWSAPKNLGAAINTNKDELHPFIVNDSVLYFTSDGHSGYGGLDLFSYNLNSSNNLTKNLGNQVNTKYNDYSLTFNSQGDVGYFCSNRPGGEGKEDIYRMHVLNLKIRYAYNPRQRTSIEDDKINLYISNGDEHNIESEENDGFNFSFLPEQDYKMVVQHENTTAKNILNDNRLTTKEKRQEIVQPSPIDKAEIKLQAGMKYQFTAGLKPISTQYYSDLNSLSQNYQNPEVSTIDLTALAKELLFTDGEIYTIRFVKDKQQGNSSRANVKSELFINDQTIDLYGKSFFIVLPLDKEVNFNIQTDISHLKENFNPKKHGIVIDKSSVFEKEINNQEWLVSMLVNTDSIKDIRKTNHLTAEEISIIPGTEYILTFGKYDFFTGENVEIFVPLTRGVKYNLGYSAQSKNEFAKALAELVIGKEGLEPVDQEVIDISILSKELDVNESDDMAFITLLPVKGFGTKKIADEKIKTSLNLDGKIIAISRQDKYVINIPIDVKRKINIQTDLEYIEKNFEPEDFTLNLDTIPFLSGITVDTTGFANREFSDWLSMSVNTNSSDDVEKQNQFIAKEVSIIPGKEYILTVSKIDAQTKEKTEIIVPLTRKVKYDFTSKLTSQQSYEESLNSLIEVQNDFETVEGEVIDIRLLSKELQIKERDEVSFSLLPARVFNADPRNTVVPKSSLYLDNKIVEFTQIQKYSINVPLNEERQVNIQTDLEHLQESHEPGTYTLDIDTVSFFSEITVDTTGYGDRVIKNEEITDPVFDVIIVNFDFNKYSLTREAKNTITREVVEELTGDSRLYVTIKGYTDALGDSDYNKKLSGQRANSVKDFLANKGIGKSRIRTFSFGESQTLKKGVKWEDLSESELRKHRKVEIVIYLPE